MKNQYKIVLLLLLFINNSYGQEQYQPTKVILPSPTAASIAIYGNNLQGTYNGVPGISVPLFQNKTIENGLNISLNYDASGTRPLQNASWIGLGWSLSYGGGVITRVVRGLDDLDQTRGYQVLGALPASTNNDKYAPNVNSAMDYEYFQDIEKGVKDGEPDIFYYNFGEYSGKFVFDKAINGSKILELDRTNLKISYTQKGWHIIDANGYNYFFNTKETAEDFSYTSDQREIYDGATIDAFTDINIDKHPITSSWYLDSIISPTSRKVFFEYSKGESVSLTNKFEQIYKLLMSTGGCSGGPGTTETGLPPEYKVYSASKQIISEVVLKKILFANGSIEFNPGAREDIEYRQIGSSRLDNVVIKDNTGNEFKKFNFYQSYFSDNNNLNKRLKLDSVVEMSRTGQRIPPYKFNYYNPGSLPPKNTKATDYWGYYNNKTLNNTMLPAQLKQLPDGSYRSYAGADRLPDTSLNSLQNGVLSSIIYPTGGRTNFYYELNDYSNLYGEEKYESIDSSLVIISGLWGYPGQQSDKAITFQIKEPRPVTFYFNYYNHNDPFFIDDLIEDYASLEKDGQYVKTFHNHPPSQTISFVDTETIMLQPGSYTMRLKALSGYSTRMQAKWVHRNLISQRKGAGLRLKKIENVDLTGRANVKSYEYTIEGHSSGLILNPVKYDYDISIMNGKYTIGPGSVVQCVTNGSYLSRSSSSITTDGFSVKGGILGYSKVTELFGEHGENGKIEYSFYNEANVLDNNSFPSLPLNGYSLNGKLLQTIIFDALNKPLRKTQYNYLIQETFSIPGVKLLNLPFSKDNFLIRYYENVSYWIVPSSVIETVYSGNDSMVTVTKSYYTNLEHRELTRKEEKLSNNDTLTIFYKYPSDYKSLTTSNVYNSMEDRHILSPVVESSRYSNSRFLQSTKTNYNYWNDKRVGNYSNLILPETVESKTSGNQSEVRLRYHSYDSSGNMLSVSKENDVQTSYLWGYNNAYPIAQVINAESSNIFHTSFEDTDGNSSIGDGKTGSFSRIGGYFKSFSKLDNGEYILSWWKKTGSDWNLQTSMVAVTGGTYSISLSGQVDEIRFYPRIAQMTTYTYDPLIGITSECDMNDKITYYEYDSFGRLRLIRDQDSNIVKKLCYGYQGQAESCPTGTGNTAKSGVFVKTCNSSETGDQVTYTVAANTYFGTTQSEADALAQTDVDTKGQAYANAHGGCSTPTSNVYARLEESLTYSDNTSTFNSSDNTTAFNYYQQVSLYLRFYSDEACTQPLILTSDVNYTIDNYGWIETEHDINHHNDIRFQGIAPKGTSEIFFDDIMPFEGFSGLYGDSGYLNFEKWKDDYKLGTLSGGFVIRPSVNPVHTQGF